MCTGSASAGGERSSGVRGGRKGIFVIVYILPTVSLGVKRPRPFSVELTCRAAYVCAVTDLHVAVLLTHAVEVRIESRSVFAWLGA